MQEEHLCERVDIFIEETAFSVAASRSFLKEAVAKGFLVTVHADQFSSGGSGVAVEAGALSADHLEASTEQDIRRLAASDTVAVVLPGASLGLGMHYAPARRAAGCGRLPGHCQRLEPWFRAHGRSADAGGSDERGGKIIHRRSVRGAYVPVRTKRWALPAAAADLQAYPCRDYRDVLYYQGRMKPAFVWKGSGEIT